MDIATLVSTIKHQQLEANFAVMNQSKQFAEDMGEQLVDMLEQSTSTHPTLGKHIDLKG